MGTTPTPKSTCYYLQHRPKQQYILASSSLQSKWPDAATTMSLPPRRQAWTTPSLCPNGALPSSSRDKIGPQRLETTKESGTEGRAARGAERWREHQSASPPALPQGPHRTPSCGEARQKSPMGTQPRRRLTRGQTVHTVPLLHPCTRTRRKTLHHYLRTT